MTAVVEAFAIKFESKNLVCSVVEVKINTSDNKPRKGQPPLRRLKKLGFAAFFPAVLVSDIALRLSVEFDA